MKRKLPGIIIFIFIVFGCTNKIKTIEWISTTPASVWQKNQIKSGSKSVENRSSIVINSEKKEQKIDGFGGCFNELGWEALNTLPDENRELIIKSLFDTLNGCRFNLGRMPIGANDYAIDWYSFDESKDDFDMTDFTIERDRKRLIPYIRNARNYNPRLSIWASPWSPPSWMKTNNHYACSPDSVNGLSEAGRGKELQNQFRMEDKYLKAYALYFSKFIHAYKKEGINISAVHVQNEPNSCQIFPSCIWSPAAITTFIGRYLGPQFEKDMINTEIWLGTIERPQIDRIDTILSNPEAKKYIKGFGFQWAGKDALPEVHKKYPDYKLMQTETECGNGSNDWKAAEHTWDLIKHYFNNGANAYMYWNMVLNETGKSQWGWKQNSMITVNSKTKEVNYNPEFYLMKHLSYFVEPGAYRIATSGENCLAFRNRGSIVVIIYNPSGRTEKSFMVDKIGFKAELAEKSFNSFKIKI
jgi:glucosylceramidase